MKLVQSEKSVVDTPVRMIRQFHHIVARVAVLFASTVTLGAQGSDFFWDNGVGTAQWNSSDANWSGELWSNSPFNNAFFRSIGDTVTLGEAVIAGGIHYGLTSSNSPNCALTGGSLTAANIVVQGKSTNPGFYGVNPTLTFAVPSVALSGDMMIGRANLVISSGNVRAHRITSSAASADWGRLVLSGGTLTVTNGIDGSTYGSVTFAIDLNGGNLRTPSIRVADREVGTHNNAWLTFHGGTVTATADNPDFIELYGGNQNAYIADGGAVIDTDGHEVGIDVNLKASGDGGLTKTGNGKLTLLGQNTYLGTTRIVGGILALGAQSAFPPSGSVEISSGALMALDFAGSIAVRSLRLNGVAQPGGTYSAATHPSYFSGSGYLVVPPPFSNDLAGASTDGMSNFLRMKYGFFVHYVWGGSAYTVTVNSDGSKPAGLDDLANRFDVQRFAEDLARMQVEYVVFTAWHANINCLWPSATMDRWLSGHTSQRDLLGDMIDAVKARGIRVMLYTHPRDGHDLSLNEQVATGWGGQGNGGNPDWNLFNRAKWNDFTNEMYADLLDRYGSRIDGLYLDEGSAAADSHRVVDYPRLRQTIKSRRPDLLMIQNNYGNLYSCDVGDQEIYGGYYGGPYDPGTNPNSWPASGNPMSMVTGSIFWASRPAGNWVVPYDAAAMFRMTVLRAGVNSNTGGGVKWAAGPYAGGGWETGVLATMEQVGAFIQPIRRSICNTLPSQSWITPANASINSLANGIVATRSPDDGTEFIHVLTAPAGNSLTVPAPADGRGYASASLLENGHSVNLVRNSDGSLTFTLQSSDAWNPRNTVIALTPVAVAWNGNEGANGSASWSETVDHFTSGIPINTRFRSGDNVNFHGQGASTLLSWDSDFAVGDLSFSGKDYLIQSSGTSTITLAGGHINVADGVTATLQQSSTGGMFKLLGDAGLTKTGAGSLVLDLPSEINGNKFLTNGVVSVRSGAFGPQGNIVFGGGTLRMLPGNQDDLSSRIRHGAAPIKIDTAGNHLVWATPLHPSNTGGLHKLGAGTLSLAGGAPVMDSFTIGSGKLTLAPATTGSVAVPNASFEVPSYAPQGWSYHPTGTSWNFLSSSGTAANNTPWVGISPEGSQVAYLQNNGSMNTEVIVSSDGHFRLSFLASNRPNYLASGVVVMLDGEVIGTLTPGQIGQGGDFNRFELPAVHLTAGIHTLAFQGQQNGSDSDTLIDDIRFVAVEAGALPVGSSLSLIGPSSVFEPGPLTLMLDALSAVDGSVVDLSDTQVVVTGNNHTATFAGDLKGVGTVTVNGTFRLVGDASLSFSGAFVNHGVLDIMTWNGTLPPSFVNNGIVLDRSKIRVNSFVKSGNTCTMEITGYIGHNYQLQRNDDLSGSWQNIGPAQAGNNAPITFNDSTGGSPVHRFYRISVSP